MNRTGVANLSFDFSGERGGSRLQLLVTGLIIAVTVYAGAQYIPVAYNATAFKEVMQRKVNEASLTSRPGQTPTEWTEAQVRAASPDYSLPTDALIDAEARDRRISLRVQYTKPIALPFYVYNYRFDHTVTSSSFFTP